MANQVYKVKRRFLFGATNQIDDLEKTYYYGATPTLSDTDPNVVAAVAAGHMALNSAASYEQLTVTLTPVAGKVLNWNVAGAGYGYTSATIDYGDGVLETKAAPASGTHTYAAAGAKTVNIVFNNGMRHSQSVTILA
jgi:hypothetical protein